MEKNLMSKATVGELVPDAVFATTANDEASLADYRGKNLVVYFYPKDNTPGCTQEGQDFRDHYEAFQSMDTEILGVSRDSIKSHNNFIAKYEFPFDLISDADESLCDLFDVIHEKNMYGRKHLGIVRSTFLIDRKGVLRNEFRKVRVKGHIDAVLEAVSAL
jgi:peroxiredoxin Q/BCP